MHRSLVRSRRLAAAAACVLSLLAAGCDGDRQPIASEMAINISGTWLAARYEGFAFYEVQRDTLFLFAGTDIPLHTASHTRMSAAVRYDGPGTYPIPAGAARVEDIIGGDGVAGRYASQPSDQAVLIVREHAGGVLSGRITFTARSTREPAGVIPPEERFDAEFQAERIRR